MTQFQEFKFWLREWDFKPWALPSHKKIMSLPDEAVPDEVVADMISETRKLSFEARWYVEKRPEIPAITETRFKTEGQILPGLSTQGLRAEGTHSRLYREIGCDLLDAFWAGDLSPEMVETLRAFVACEWEAGRTIGGLPFFGQEQIDPMELQAYCSDAMKADHTDPMSHASYGDILAKEPHCLMINLGSSQLIGWLWGDCYTLTLSVSRAELEAGRFDQVNWMIDNG